MAVFKIHKTSNYTIVSTTHLREKEMSLKAKGLLTIMLSLPENWDFSVMGLTALSKDGKDAVMATIEELGKFGYLKVETRRNERGQYESTYNVYEDPNLKNQFEKSESANPAQYNIEKNNKNNTPIISNDISPKGEDVDDGFEEFWEKYDKKVQRVQAERMWRKLNKSQKQEILASVEAYVASTPDKQYRMYPATYLNPKNKRWQDELRTNSTSLIDSSKSFEERRDAFYDKINALIPNYSNEYGREGAKRLLYAFYLRWAEKTQDGLYMRWEIEKTFEFDKRLAMFIQDNGWKYKH